MIEYSFRPVSQPLLAYIDINLIMKKFDGILFVGLDGWGNIDEFEVRGYPPLKKIQKLSKISKS